MKWGNKRVLVTGAAGFIGQNLVKRLLNEGAYVIAFDKFIYAKKDSIPKSVKKIVSGDVMNRKDLIRVKDVDYVFHFGSPSSVILFNKNPELCVHSTVCGFMSILEWGRQVGVNKLVYPSSGSVYGNTSLPQSEDMNPQPINLYGVCKFTSELMAKRYSDVVPNIGLRIFAGYGFNEEHKEEFASVVTLFLNSIARNKRPVIYGDGMQRRDFIYIDDIVDTILAATERNVTGIVNVGSGKAYTFNDIIDIINHLLNKNIKPIYVEKPAKYIENTWADITKLKEKLGINPLSLEEGIRKYIFAKELLK